MSIDGLNPGGYVFISHSHQDIEKVRQIRNAMEEAGYEPLCFYLKCLSDEDEIENLLKREIDAREWFVYVDSPNARASSWVARERAYIASLGNKQVVTIDLDEATSLKEVARKLIRGLRVLIVCDEEDRSLGRALENCFRAKDMQTFLQVGPDTPTGATDVGCVVRLLSSDAPLGWATDDDARQVSLLVDGYEPPASALPAGGTVYLLTGSPSRQRLEELVRRVETDVTHDLKKAFAQAASHSEVESYYLNSAQDPEAARLAREAQERLDEEERIKDDIRESLARGTMQMTEQLKKFLES